MSFGQATGDASGCRALPGRYDDTHASVTAASHGSTTGVHHEADQEPAKVLENGVRNGGKKRLRQRKRQTESTPRTQEDESHAVITTHPNKVRNKRENNQPKTKKTTGHGF